MNVTSINRRTKAGCMFILALSLVFLSVQATCQEPENELPFIPIEDPAVMEPVAANDLNDARILFGRLEEQVRIASAKLTPASMDRKKQVGTFRSLLSAADSRIAVVTAQIQMQEERQRQLRENHLGRVKDSSSAAGFDELMKRADEPTKRLRAELDRLTRRRSQLQSKLEALQDEHIRCLLEAAVQPPEPDQPASGVLDSMLEEVLGETR